MLIKNIFTVQSDLAAASLASRGGTDGVCSLLLRRPGDAGDVLREVGRSALGRADQSLDMSGRGLQTVLNVLFNNELQFKHKTAGTIRFAGIRKQGDTAMTEPMPGVSGDLSYIRRSGSGSVVVFLHGIGSSAASFAPLFGHLPADLSLLAWNAPGYSNSAPLAEDWPMAGDYADALAGLLDRLGHGAVHLVGHSLGTLIAAVFARRSPDRVQSLTLAAAAKGYGVPRGGKLPDGVAARLTDLARLGPAAFASARAANLVHEPERHPEIVKSVEAAMAQVNPAGYAQAVRMLASGDLPGDLAHVAARPGFIIGAQDRVTPMAQTLAAADAWEAAMGAHPTVTEIDRAGHAVYLQRPDAFCTALLDHMGLPAARNPEGA